MNKSICGVVRASGSLCRRLFEVQTTPPPHRPLPSSYPKGLLPLSCSMGEPTGDTYTHTHSHTSIHAAGPRNQHTFQHPSFIFNSFTAVRDPKLLYHIRIENQAKHTKTLLSLQLYDSRSMLFLFFFLNTMLSKTKL